MQPGQPLCAACLASSKQAPNQHYAIVQPSVPGHITSIFYPITGFLLFCTSSLWHARSVLASAISYTSPSLSSTCLSCLVSSFVLYVFIFIIGIKPTFVAADSSRRSHFSTPFSHLSSPHFSMLSFLDAGHVNLHFGVIRIFKASVSVDLRKIHGIYAN